MNKPRNYSLSKGIIEFNSLEKSVEIEEFAYFSVENVNELRIHQLDEEIDVKKKLLKHHHPSDGTLSNKNKKKKVNGIEGLKNEEKNNSDFLNIVLNKSLLSICLFLIIFLINDYYSIDFN